MIKNPLKKYLHKFTIYNNKKYDVSTNYLYTFVFNHKYELIKRNIFINDVISSKMTTQLFNRYMNNTNWIW